MRLSFVSRRADKISLSQEQASDRILASVRSLLFSICHPRELSSHPFFVPSCAVRSGYFLTVPDEFIDSGKNFLHGLCDTLAVHAVVLKYFL